MREAAPPRRSLLADLPRDWPLVADRKPLLATVVSMADAPCPNPFDGTRALLASDAEFAASPELASLHSFASAWFAHKDHRLWARLSVAPRPAPWHVDSLELIELCRWIRSHRALDLSTIRRYAAAWPLASRKRLVDALRAIPSIAERCLFLASYRPGGRVPQPPFALAAEILIAVSLEGYRQ